MNIRIGKLAIVLSLAILILFAVFMINQTAQIVELANTVSSTFGRVVLYTLLALYALLILIPTISFARMPGPLHPPEDESSEEFREYLDLLARRLSRNPLLAGHEVLPEDRASIETALTVLDARATHIIKETATTVFVSTAISQSGQLDGIMVLVAQSRMVWRIARIYYQRPTLRQIVNLYANVAATTFLVRELEDLDIAEQVEPMITSALSGSVVGVVPGISVVAGIVTDSILEGTANAFLTLRVGIIARRYCASLSAFDRRSVRRFASVEAASLLGSIVLKSAGTVSRSIIRAARKAGVGTVESVVGGVSKGTRGLTRRMGSLTRPLPNNGDDLGELSFELDEDLT